jgi:hypothetical protein
MLKHAITHRDDFIMAQALIFALEALRRLPEDQRPESNIDDMKAILAELPSTAREMAERDTGRWLMVGAWEVTKRLMRTNSAGELMDAPGRARYSG